VKKNVYEIRDDLHDTVIDTVSGGHLLI
jgi:hypothetical protein